MKSTFFYHFLLIANIFSFVFFFIFIVKVSVERKYIFLEKKVKEKGKINKEK